MSSNPNEITEFKTAPPTEVDEPRPPQVGLDNQSTMPSDDPFATRYDSSTPAPSASHEWSDSEMPGMERPRSGSPSYSSWNGTDFGKYELLGELGRGGMGVVYKARQKGLERVVAVKMILGSHMAGPDQVDRFYAEARAAARLNDPHVVAIHDVGEIHGQHYFAMEFIDGPSLADRLKTHQISMNEGIRILATVAHAVGRLHARGIVHRDLKPSNILLDSEYCPFVTDFGLVKLVDKEQDQTYSGTIMGTPSYMAPEQALGKASEVGPLSDVYSLGAILYEILTGKPPFCEASPIDTLTKTIHSDPIPPRERNTSVPSSLELVCLKCLEKKPSDRYATAHELADDLERHLEGEDVLAQRANFLIRVKRWARREPALASRLGGLSLSMIVSQSNYSLLNSQSENPISLGVHLSVMALLATWLLASWGYQVWFRQGRRADLIHLLWAATDLSALTAILIVDNAMISPLICAYPLMIAASGLWFRVVLVWATTALAEVAYAGLILDAYIREGQILHPARHFMAMVTLGVLGIVIVALVKRVRVLTENRERRPAH